MRPAWEDQLTGGTGRCSSTECTQSTTNPESCKGKDERCFGACPKSCNGKVQVEAVQCLLEQFSKQQKPQTTSHRNPQTRPKTQTLLLSCSQE